MGFDEQVLARLDELADSPGSARAKLENMLRYLAKWRSTLIENTMVAECGVVVQRGPFAGMTFVSHSTEGCHTPKLLGCYEAELHPFLHDVVDRDYDVVINIGSAEGYYAVGLARLMPSVNVYAYDTNEKSHPVCRAVAEVNGVADRVKVGSTFHGEDFVRFSRSRTLVICDIEGGEVDLLDPRRFPALEGMDIIVELHDHLARTPASTIVPSRFAETHEVTMVKHGGRDVPLPAFCDRLGHLDQLLAVWEWRQRPTPWAVMLSRTNTQTAAEKVKD